MRIMTEIGNLNDLFARTTSNETVDFYLNLPLEAILSFFKANIMKSSSEGVVLKVILIWLKHNRKEDYTNLLKLRECVRVGLFDFCLMNEIIRDLKWMGLSPSQKSFMLSSVSNPHVKVDVLSVARSHQLPEIWFKKRDYLLSFSSEEISAMREPMRKYQISLRSGMDMFSGLACSSLRKVVSV